MSRYSRAARAALFVTGVTALLPAMARGQTTEPFGQQTLQNVCVPGTNDVTSVHFPAMAAASNAVLASYCADNGYGTVRAQVEAILVVLQVGEQEFAELETGIPYNEVVDRASALALQRIVPNMILRRLQPIGLGMSGDAWSVDDSATCDSRADSAVAGKTCIDVLEEFVAVFNNAQLTLSGPEARRVASALEGLSEEWDRFAADSRSQTALEKAFNGYLFKKQESSEFQGPPSLQWIVLHPSIALEYVDNARDGDQTEEALIIEVLGFDLWSQDRWYLPSGGSAVAAFSDRPDITNWGYGVAVHFQSNFTIGWTDRDGDGAVFLSVDLWKLFQDKRGLVEAYRGKIF